MVETFRDQYHHGREETARGNPMPSGLLQEMASNEMLDGGEIFGSRREVRTTEIAEGKFEIEAGSRKRRSFDLTESSWAGRQSFSLHFLTVSLIVFDMLGQ